MKTKAIWLVLCFAVGLSPAISSSTIQLTFGEMVANSDSILIGRTIAAEGVRVDRMIYTRYTIAVSRKLKGVTTETITVLVPGGRLDGDFPVAMTVAGAPRLLTDEDVLLFLERVPAAGPGKRAGAGYRIIGLDQGKLSIITDRAGKRRLTHGLPLDRDTERKTAKRTTTDLAGLEALIAESLAQ